MTPFVRVTTEMRAPALRSSEPLLPIALPLATADQPYLPLPLPAAGSSEQRA